MTKILLVEDDKSLREIYGVRLLAEGYDIVSAGDGEEALAMSIKEKPTLIISDVMMPKISGFDMLDILRSTTETRDIKVIMMTALSSDDQRARGEQLGADRYLVKSQVGIEDVVRTVHEVLQDSANTPPADTPSAPTIPTPSPAEPTDTPVSTPADNTGLANTVTVDDSAAPGNTSAGPLPPQPDSILPQPTAPFSSPRPATLGERIIDPLTPDESDAGETSEQIAQELQASSEPIVNSQVDDAITDQQALESLTPLTPTTNTTAPQIPTIEEPAVDPIAPTSSTSFDTPIVSPLPSNDDPNTPAPGTQPPLS